MYKMNKITIIHNQNYTTAFFAKKGIYIVKIQLLFLTLFFLCNIVAMNSENTLTHSYINDLSYNPYLMLTDKQRPTIKQDQSVLQNTPNKHHKEISKITDQDKYLLKKIYTVIQNNNRVTAKETNNALFDLADKYKIQNLYVALTADILPIELQNIIVKNYHSLITYTKNKDKALSHFKQSLLNHKISTNTIKQIKPTMPGSYVPYLHEYSYDKKYGIHKESDDCVFLYDVQTNKKISPKESILAACFLHKKNSIAYINKNEQLIQYDITEDKRTIITSHIPRSEEKDSHNWQITTEPNDSIFITLQNKQTGIYTQLILASLDGTLKTIINTPFIAITFNKNRSLVVISEKSKVTLYSFNDKNLNHLADNQHKIYNGDAEYTKLHFNNECNSFIAKTDKYSQSQNAILFRIICENNNYFLKAIIASNIWICHHTLYHSKHNCSSTLIEYKNKPVRTFDHNGKITSCTQHPKEIHKSAISKNGQFLASISESTYNKTQTLTIQNLFNNHTSSTEIEVYLIGNPLKKLHFHPNSTLLIGDSFQESIIYTLQNDALVTVPIAPYSNSYFNKSETIWCNSQNYYELYASEDLENLNKIIPNDSINLLQYFALKRIDDKKRDINGKYTVPQTLFNKLCWKSFKKNDRKSLSQTLNLKIKS